MGTRLDWGGVGGLAFVILVALAAGPFGNQLDSHRDKSDFVSYYGGYRGSSHEWKELVSTLLVFVASFSFPWFLRRLRDLVRPVDDGLAALALGGGFLFLALLVSGFVVATSVGTTLAYSDDFQVSIDTAILMSNIALFLLTAAAAAASVTIWATSLAARRGGVLPGWLAWSGFVVAVVGLAMIALDGISVVLELAWVVAVSVLVLRRRWIATAPA